MPRSKAKGPCEVYGAVTVDAHHDHYEEPLNVRLLCRRHHVKLHLFGEDMFPRSWLLRVSDKWQGLPNARSEVAASHPRDGDAPDVHRTWGCRTPQGDMLRKPASIVSGRKQSGAIVALAQTQRADDRFVRLFHIKAFGLECSAGPSAMVQMIFMLGIEPCAKKLGIA